jgi:hypothetical protein
VALLLDQAAQPVPVPGSGLKDGLDEILGPLPVLADQHAGVPEQITGVGTEARGEFLGLARRDPLLTHRSASASRPAGPGGRG